MTSRRTPGPAGTVGCVVPQSNRSSYSPSSLLADDPADLILPRSGQTGRRSRKFVTVTAPKAMKAVVDAMFVADAVSSVRMAYQGWKFARMGAKALAKGGTSSGGAKCGGTSKVDKALDLIKRSGAKGKINPKGAGQEGNVTLQYRSGPKVNLRVESHPLGGSTKPVRHGNVEVIKNIKGKNVKKMNIHITE